jgi:hypothetical protein
MRTTVNLEPSAFEAARAKSVHENKSLGQAISELILSGIQGSGPKRNRRSKAVFKSAGGVYSSVQVEAALEDE